MINEFQPMNHLSRLQNFICTIGNLPTSYVLSMSYEEQIWWLCDFLDKKVLPAIENNTEITEKTQRAFLELQNYVKDYFNNLDVQEEINNKLDEMVDDGTLENIINNEIFGKISYNLKFIFPKSINSVSGDIGIIKIYDKIILIDTFLSNKWEDVEAFLIRNNVSKIDYCILTHYHVDHVGNFINLVNNNFIDENTTIYLPAYSSLIEQNQTNYNLYISIQNFLTTHEELNYLIPSEGDFIEINDFKLTFYNCETQIFINNNYIDYNDCSTICLIEYGNKKALFTGDASYRPFNRFLSSNMLNFKIDFYKIEHHGINNAFEPLPFLEKITPSFAYQSGFIVDTMKNNFSQSTTCSFLRDINCKIFSSYNNDNDIIFNISHNDINCVGKENLFIGSKMLEKTVIVDGSSSNIIQDGSQNYPFKDLSEAISQISKNKNFKYTIILKSGEYNNTHEQSAKNRTKITNMNVLIKSESNNTNDVIIKNGFDVNNSNVIIQNVIIEANNSNCIVSSFSNLLQPKQYLQILSIRQL